MHYIEISHQLVNHAFNLKNSKKEDSGQSISTLQETQKANVSRFISKEVKAKFIDFITNKNYSMKEAAKMVKMSYSTAKKIYRRFRHTNAAKNSVKTNQNLIQASYREIEQNSVVRVSISCLIAGSYQNCCSFQQ